MKLFLHDYSGHAFALQLSRELARQGHQVVHAYSAAIESPRGAIHHRDGDPAHFTILPIGMAGSLNKYNPIHRVIEERRYGMALADAINQNAPDAVITSTTPNDVMDMLRGHLPKTLRLVWWVQDIYSIGIRSVFNRKFPFLGDVAGLVYREKEKRFARRVDHIVSITADFIPFLEGLGAPRSKITVIENWAPADEIVPLPHENAWKTRHGFAGKPLVLYSGTLGLKHNPAMLADVATRFRQEGRDAMVVAATQGLGAEFLSAEKGKRGLLNLTVLPWQSYEDLPEMLASADVLTAMIEPDAGLFSVPSKILSCFCAGRPVVAAIPSENLAARTIEAAGAGFVTVPNDRDAFVDRIVQLLDDAALRQQLGGNGRFYAEQNFAIDHIAARFIALFR